MTGEAIESAITKEQLQVALQNKDIEYIKHEITVISDSVKEVASNTVEAIKTYSIELTEISNNIASMYEIMVSLKEADVKINSRIDKSDAVLDDTAVEIKNLMIGANIYKEKISELTKQLSDVKKEIDDIRKDIKAVSASTNTFFGKLVVTKSILTTIVAVALLFAKDIFKWLRTFFI